jgi:nucleoside phosphorylase
MKILVTFALENEFAPWRKLRAFRPGVWGAAKAWFSELDRAELGVVLTGVGPKCAGARASEVTWGESDSVDVCISSGFAGSLRQDVQVCQIIAPKCVSSGQVRTEMGANVVSCDAPLVALAAQRGARMVEKLHTVDHVVTSAAEKNFLGKQADAVDMESFEVIQESESFGVRSLAIRAVSDTLDEDLPFDLNEVLSEGRVSVPRVVGQLARRPQALPALVRLGRRSRAAAEALAKFLDGYVQAIALGAGEAETRVAAAAR